MSGGFTLSGGEPLMQDRFAVKLLAAAKQMEIHTALDTNGSLGARLSDAELENIDLVLLDLKSWEPELHRRITGMEVGPVLDFARRLADRRKKIWVRFVLVPGLSDDPEERRQDCEICGGPGNRATSRRSALPPNGAIQMDET